MGPGYKASRLCLFSKELCQYEINLLHKVSVWSASLVYAYIKCMIFIGVFIDQFIGPHFADRKQKHKQKFESNISPGITTIFLNFVTHDPKFMHYNL